VSTNSVLYRNYSIVGVYAGAYRRGVEEDTYRADVYAEVTDLLQRGLIHPVIDAEVLLAEAPVALTRLIKRSVVGKVIVRP
jgi:NADPH:quinone reductase-like Zn-dependent oxidoreductase